MKANAMSELDIADRFQQIKRRVGDAATRAGRDPESIIIIGATKQVEPARIQQAIEAGLRDVGENYVQDALPKMTAIGTRVRWHFIGHLQSNKVRQVIGKFQFIHSVNRTSLLTELEKRAAAAEGTIQALIEVNVAGEETKTGATVEAVREILQRGVDMRHIRLIGLMTMPPFSDEPEASRQYFRRLREMLDQLQSEFQSASLAHLSMGMTNDFEIAIEEGATMVRIGTGIFGHRKG